MRVLDICLATGLTSGKQRQNSSMKNSIKSLNVAHGHGPGGSGSRTSAPSPGRGWTGEIAESQVPPILDTDNSRAEAINASADRSAEKRTDGSASSTARENGAGSHKLAGRGWVILALAGLCWGVILLIAFLVMR